jgi:hypothetical protein
MRSRTGVIAVTVFAACVLKPNVGRAEPLTVSGTLNGDFHGAQFIEDISFTFPTFNLDIFGVTYLQPGLCDCRGPQPLTQTTGDFQGQAFVSGTTGGSLGNVQGRLNFTGPFVTLPPVNGPFDAVVVSDAITWSGFLNVTQGAQTLFNGMLSGTGTGTLGAGPHEADFFYAYSLKGVSATPEPASIVLICTAVAWVVATRRRRSSPLSSPSDPAKAG